MSFMFLFFCHKLHCLPHCIFSDKLWKIFELTKSRAGKLNVFTPFPAVPIQKSGRSKSSVRRQLCIQYCFNQ